MGMHALLTDYYIYTDRILAPSTKSGLYNVALQKYTLTEIQKKKWWRYVYPFLVVQLCLTVQRVSGAITALHLRFNKTGLLPQIPRVLVCRVPSFLFWCPVPWLRTDDRGRAGIMSTLQSAPLCFVK